MMDRRRLPGSGAGQEGFSMIEMLMTAFILAVGLLGLCMLQTLSLRAGQGSTGLTTAVKVAEGVEDQIEMEGRLSWLNITDSKYLAPSNANLPNLKYIPLPLLAPMNPPLYFNVHGDTPITTSTDPSVSATFFTVNVTHTQEVGNIGGTAGSLGDYNVVVTFLDNSNNSATPATRTVSLTRRIAHG